MNIRNSLIIVGLAGQICLWLGISIMGKHGWYTWYTLNKQYKAIEQEIAHERKALESIEHNIAALETCPFYKEKIAREQLHMARSQETVYFIDEHKNS